MDLINQLFIIIIGGGFYLNVFILNCSFLITTLFGYTFRSSYKDEEGRNLNLFNFLPIGTILGFLIFGSCFSFQQPRLFKRLKLQFGRTLERKLTLSQSKQIQRGMTIHQLPTNLNNFLPDEQGPQISTFKFYSSICVCICLMHFLVFYGFNQPEIWKQTIKSNENYIYLMMLSFLVLGEVGGMILYQIDSYLSLELQNEFQFMSSIFTVSVYRLFFLFLSSSLLKAGGSILIKIIFKILINYVYPIHYESIKARALKLFRFCHQPLRPVEFNETKRKEFSFKWMVLQYSELMSLIIFIASIFILYEISGNQDNYYSKMTSEVLGNVGILCGVDLVIEILLSITLTCLLSRKDRFQGMTISQFITDISTFLIEGKHVPILAFLAVTATISISISNFIPLQNGINLLLTSQ